MKIKALTAIAALLVSTPMFAVADENAELIVNGEIKMITRAPAPDHLKGAVDEIFSGWLMRTEDTQALQMDDFENPAMVYVDQAMTAWGTVEGSEGKSCASCHDGPESMQGVRAVYPKWNEAAGAVRTLAQQVNDCRVNRMGAEEYKYAGAEMNAMEALISVQSRGMPVNVAIDGPAQATWEKGKEIYYTRYGQLELSCANCHEDNATNWIRADHLSQGQINGFPVYRLKDTQLTQVQKRFEGCIRDTRSVGFKPGSDEAIALELYVASRGNGLSVEAPSVRH